VDTNSGKDSKDADDEDFFAEDTKEVDVPMPGLMSMPEDSKTEEESDDKLEVTTTLLA
jgi:hypothetical protein